MKLRNNKTTQRGFTFIELVMSLVFMALAVTVVLGVGRGLMEDASVSRANTEITHIRAAASIYASPGDFTGMTMGLIHAGPAVGSGSGTNPWKGDYAITVTSGNASYTLTVTDVPTNAQGRLITTMGEGATATPTVASGTNSVAAIYDR